MLALPPTALQLHSLCGYRDAALAGLSCSRSAHDLYVRSALRRSAARLRSRLRKDRPPAGAPLHRAGYSGWLTPAFCSAASSASARSQYLPRSVLRLLINLKFQPAAFPPGEGSIRKIRWKRPPFCSGAPALPADSSPAGGAFWRFSNFLAQTAKKRDNRERNRSLSNGGTIIKSVTFSNRSRYGGRT